MLSGILNTTQGSKSKDKVYVIQKLGVVLQHLLYVNYNLFDPKSLQFPKRFLS